MISELLNPVGNCSPDWLSRAPSLPSEIDPASLEVVEARARAQRPADDKLFVSQCSLAGLSHRLPLGWPVPPDVPDSPKNKYRSGYVYQGRDDLDDPAT